MNPKLISAIKSVLMAAMTLLSVFGIGQYAGLVEIILENFDPLVQAISTILAFLALLRAWTPVTDNETAGALARKKFRKSAKAQSGGDKRDAFFEFVDGE